MKGTAQQCAAYSPHALSTRHGGTPGITEGREQLEGDGLNDRDRSLELGYGTSGSGSHESSLSTPSSHCQCQCHCQPSGQMSPEAPRVIGHNNEATPDSPSQSSGPSSSVDIQQDPSHGPTRTSRTRPRYKHHVFTPSDKSETPILYDPIDEDGIMAFCQWIVPDPQYPGEEKLCLERYSTADHHELRSHIVNDHFGGGPAHEFVCRWRNCKQRLRSMQAASGGLRRHLLSHGLKLKCDLCNAALSRADAFRRHMTLKHPDEAVRYLDPDA